jgi:hypothetical protein
MISSENSRLWTPALGEQCLDCAMAARRGEHRAGDRVVEYLHHPGARILGVR